MPGPILYGEVLASIMDMYLPIQISQIFTKMDIQPSDFFTEQGWIQSLFAQQIPTCLMDRFVSSFLRYGWPFFFGVYLSFISSLQTEIKSINNNYTPKNAKLMIISLLKLQRHREPVPQEKAGAKQMANRAVGKSPMENFRNLSESSSALDRSHRSDHLADENFDMDDEERSMEDIVNLQRGSVDETRVIDNAVHRVSEKQPSQPQ
jgi:hypothetical protein